MSSIYIGHFSYLKPRKLMWTNNWIMFIQKWNCWSGTVAEQLLKKYMNIKRKSTKKKQKEISYEKSIFMKANYIITLGLIPTAFIIHTYVVCSDLFFFSFSYLIVHCVVCCMPTATTRLRYSKKKWWWWWHVRLYFSISKCPRFTSSTPFWIRLNWIPYKILQEIAFIPVHDIRICCHWRFSAHFRFICRRIPLIVIST